MAGAKKDCWNDRTHREIEMETTAHLWRYIQKHSRISTPAELFGNVTKLSSEEIELLATAHLLMSEKSLHFLAHTAPELVRRLSKTVQTTNVTSRNGIRGRIHWQETYSRRLAEGLDPSLYVTGDRSSFFDLPENRIFKFLLQRFQQLAHSFQKSKNKIPAILDERLLFSNTWKIRIEQIVLLCGKMLQTIQLQNCTVIKRLNSSEINKIKHSRSVFYRELSDMAVEYQLCVKSPETYLMTCIGQHVLMPLDRNILYELAVLFRILELCPQSGWEEQAVSLIGGNRRKVSIFKRGETLLHIYYQGLPSSFESNSAYGPLMLKYDLSNHLRRPDIILEVITADGKYKYFIIEVKRSEERTYIADGVYKLLGYLRDYENVSFLPDHQVSGVLVSWSGGGTIEYITGDPVYIAKWNTLDTLIGLLMS